MFEWYIFNDTRCECLLAGFNSHSEALYYLKDNVDRYRNATLISKEMYKKLFPLAEPNNLN